jgi:pyruvate/2-oxoacid:ferredoxin oxidoreductase beta subunit/NAD-dependent dihydropyrimidine dehydrogenase PreA subunit
MEKELHEVELQHAAPLFDIETYVADFNRSIVPAYRRGVADREQPADIGLARSVIPPGTAASRDFSTLASTIPAFAFDACVGCMACVNVCPDSAVLGIANPRAEIEERINVFAASAARPEEAATELRAHFADTAKYGKVPVRKGLDPALFGIFIDPVHCKGCAECVEVCHSLGYDALHMVGKTAGPAEGESTLDLYERDMRFFRSLPPTPEAYRSEKALADLMLGEHAIGYVGGAGSCSGCGEATAIRMLVAATRQTYGPEGMGIVAATGCNTVFGATYPFNPYLVSWTNSLFENAPAVALGIRLRWEQEGHPERRLWVLGGDGAMFDIGFQSLSRMIAAGDDIKVMVLDTQAYSNTGGQASMASFGGQITKLSAYGREVRGRPEARKELGRILMAHGNAYVAQVTAANVNHFYRAILEANEFPGPAVVLVYTPCQPEHGIADDASQRQSALAVESRTFPVFTYDPRRGESIAERISLNGNPHMRDDWSTRSDGTVVDFLTFARSEGRFAAHFAADGSSSPEMLATREDRLANWRALQELAGIPRAGGSGSGARTSD